MRSNFERLSQIPDPVRRFWFALAASVDDDSSMVTDPERPAKSLHIGLASLLAVAILVSLPASDGAAVGSQARFDVATARAIEAAEVETERADVERPGIDARFEHRSRDCRLRGVPRSDAGCDLPGKLSFGFFALPPPAVC